MPVVELERLAVERDVGRGLGVLGDHGPGGHRGRRRRARAGRARGRARRWPAGRRPGRSRRSASSWPWAICSSASRPTRSASAARKASFAPCSGTRSCGRLGPGQRGHDVAEVELDGVGEGRLLGVLVVPEALLLGVGLDERRRAPSGARRSAGSAASRRSIGKIAQVEPNSGLMLPIVARSASGSARHAGAVELDELAHDALLAQQLGDREDEVGRGGALGQLAVELEAEDLRDEHRHRLAEHRRLGLDAADAPAQHAEAVDHRRVRVGADERVGVGVAGLSSTKTTRARYSRLTWCTMPVSGGTTEKLSKASWPQRRNA